VAAAPDGSVTADAATVDALAGRITAEPLTAVEHRGIGEVPWFRISERADAPR
jgi:hypothetical protein